MSVRKRGDTWHYDFTVEGVRYRGSAETPDERTARIVEHRRKDAILRGEYRRQADAISFAAAIDLYCEHHAKHLSSWRTVKVQIEKLPGFVTGGTPVSQIDDAMIARMVAKLRASRKNPTVNGYLRTVRAVLMMARDVWGQKIQAIRWSRHMLREPLRESYLTADEAERLLDSAHEMLRPMIRLMLATGVRWGNVAQLRWRQVDLGGRVLRLRVKGDKPHEVDLTPEMVAMLANLPRRADGYVFDTTNFRKRWKAAITAAGLAGFRVHDLRHTWATWAIKAGVPLPVVKDVLNHNDIATTMRYAHHSRDARRAAMDATAQMRHKTSENSANMLEIRRVSSETG